MIEKYLQHMSNDILLIKEIRSVIITTITIPIISKHIGADLAL